MTERSVVQVMMRSRLLAEPEGPAAQHDGQFVAPVVDQNGNQWVILAVGNGSGSGDTTTLESGPDDGDSEPNFSRPLIDANGLAVVNHPFLANIDSTGALADAWDRWRVASGNSLQDITSDGSALTTGPGQIGHNHMPAAAIQATIAVAPPLNTSFVVTGVSFGFNAVNAEAGTHIVTLKQGAAANIQQWRIGPFAAGQSAVYDFPDLNIPGDLGLTVTLSFDAAGAAGNFEWVNITGYFAHWRV